MPKLEELLHVSAGIAPYTAAPKEQPVCVAITKKVKMGMAELVRSLGRYICAGVTLSHMRCLVLVFVVRSALADREPVGVRLNRELQ